MELRAYQKELINQINNEFSLGTTELVVAAAPNSGKTFTIIEFIKQNPKNTFLLLTHGTNVLKNQWELELEKHDVSASKNPGVERVTYGLPQSFSKKSTLEKFQDIDYLIIDEAHEFTFAKMIEKIKKKVNPKRVIYLTGTPSIFIKKGYKLVCVPGETLIKEGYCSDLYIGLVSTKANLQKDDYNDDGDLLDKHSHKLEDTVNTDLDELLRAIHKRLSETSFFKNSPTLRRTIEWAPTLGALHKTMIACRSIIQAQKVKEYFERNNIKVYSSESDSDVDSLNIQKFINEPDVPVLVVVNRGILGFNMEELVNVVDLTCSKNINRIYQLFSRVTRKHDNHPSKYFFKFSTDEFMLINKFYMNAALSLLLERFITKYNGKNLNSAIKIPMFVDKKERNKNEDKTQKKSNNPVIKLPIDPMFYEEVTSLKFLTDLYNKVDENVNEYAFCTFGDIKNNIFGENIKRRIINITEENIRYMIETGQVDERIYEYNKI